MCKNDDFPKMKVTDFAKICEGKGGRPGGCNGLVTLCGNVYIFVNICCDKDKPGPRGNDAEE